MPSAERISFVEEGGASWLLEDGEGRSRGARRVPILVDEEDGVGLRVLSSWGMSVPFGFVEDSGVRVLSSFGITVPFPILEDSGARVLSSFGINVP